jgi:WD40 repeat protein
VAFSRGGRLLASGGYDKTVRVWDLATGKVTRSFTGHEAWVPTLAFHPKDSLLASGSGDKRILVNRYNKRTKPIEIKEHNGVHAVAFDPEGEHLVAAGFAGGLRLWHVRSGDWRRSFKGHTSDVYAATFSPDGKLLASGSADQTIRLWDVSTAKTLRTLTGHTDWVLSLTFNPEGTLLRSAGRDGSLRTWDVASGKPLTVHKVTGEPIHAADFSPNGRFIALSSGRQVKLLDAVSGQVLRRFPAQPKNVTAVVFSPDGHVLAWGCNDASIQVWTAKAP